MEVDCEGCAGCCVDWRELSLDAVAPERTGDRDPVDGAHNFVPLEREEVRGLLADGLGDVLTPRLWTLPTASEGGESGTETGESSDAETGGDDADTSERERSDPDRTVAIDGFDLAAVDGRPVFYVGLRKPPKPVAPFDREDAAWLPTCVFLDPETLQCRVYESEHYPEACAAYPGYNLLFDQETECERVEAVHGGERLVDDEPPTDPPGVGVGAQSLGSKLFAHPDPEALDGRIERIARGEATDEDRATFAAVAAASSPGTLTVAEERRAEAREQALSADSWAGRAIEEWTELAGGTGGVGETSAAADPALGERVEERRGAPSTPGWE